MLHLRTDASRNRCRSRGAAAVALSACLAAFTAPPARAGGLPARSPHAHAAAVTPLSVVRHWMRRTHEGTYRRVHFKKISPRVTVPDGRGGTITAVIGVRYPTADGKGQLVFFFHGRKFLGWDTARESIAIASIHRGRGPRLRVRYVHYAPSDAYCCPSRSPVTVTYRWTGKRIVASRVPPNATGPRVRLAATQARWHRCADVGPRQSDTGVYYIRMLRISCASGRRILHAWYYDRSAPDAGPRGWRCHVNVSSYSERHYCRRGEQRIRFTLLYA